MSHETESDCELPRDEWEAGDRSDTEPESATVPQEDDPLEPEEATMPGDDEPELEEDDESGYITSGSLLLGAGRDYPPILADGYEDAEVEASQDKNWVHKGYPPWSESEDESEDATAKLLQAIDDDDNATEDAALAAAIAERRKQLEGNRVSFKEKQPEEDRAASSKEKDIQAKTSVLLRPFDPNEEEPDDAFSKLDCEASQRNYLRQENMLARMNNIKWRDRGPRPGQGHMPEIWKKCTFRPNAHGGKGRWCKEAGDPYKKAIRDITYGKIAARQRGIEWLVDNGFQNVVDWKGLGAKGAKDHGKGTGAKDQGKGNCAKDEGKGSSKQ